MVHATESRGVDGQQLSVHQYHQLAYRNQEFLRIVAFIV